MNVRATTGQTLMATLPAPVRTASRGPTLAGCLGTGSGSSGGNGGTKPVFSPGMRRGLTQLGLGVAAAGLFMTSLHTRQPQFLLAANLTFIAMGTLQLSWARERFGREFKKPDFDHAFKRASLRSCFSAGHSLFWTLGGLFLSLGYPDSNAGLILSTLGSMVGVHMFSHTTQRAFEDLAGLFRKPSASTAAKEGHLSGEPPNEAEGLFNYSCEILGLSPQEVVDKDLVRRKFRKLLKELHPDRHPENREEATEQVKRVLVAHGIICNYMQQVWRGKNEVSA